MYKKSFFLLSTTAALFAEQQAPHQLPQLPMLQQLASRAAQQSAVATQGNQFPEDMRKVVLEAAPSEIKKLLKVVKDREFPEHLKPRRILLHGPAGCGKTTLAQVFAQEADMPCIFVHSALLGNEYQNSVTSNLLRLLEPHLNKPCVIVFDEIEILLKKSKDNKEDTSIQMINLLDMLSRRPNVLVIGTTNNLQDIEKPLQSRFAADTIGMKLDHSFELRKKIFLAHVKNVQYSIPDTYFDSLLNSTKHFSIRDIESLIRWASMIAFNRNSKIVSPEDFQEAIKRVEEGRKAVANTESWKDFAIRKANDLGDSGWKGVGAAAGSSLFLAACPSEASNKIIDVLKKAASPDNIKNAFQKFIYKK
jgi:SpoVK/Ycf46/Vps4 family AAA+-type ATPase